MKTTFAGAINHGLRRALEDDPKVVLMGEDIGRLGGVFRVTDTLQKDFAAKISTIPALASSRAQKWCRNTRMS
ncbi:hypothetical protein ACWELQ_39130, partial [Nocardia sp. NPDC004722]